MTPTEHRPITWNRLENFHMFSPAKHATLSSGILNESFLRLTTKRWRVYNRHPAVILERLFELVAFALYFSRGFSRHCVVFFRFGISLSPMKVFSFEVTFSHTNPWSLFSSVLHTVMWVWSCCDWQWIVTSTLLPKVTCRKTQSVTCFEYVCK